MNSGLPEAALEKILEILRAEERVARVILYGSRAKGTFKTGSDIDLALEGSGLDLSVISALETRLDDLMLPWEIDLAVVSEIDNVELLGHIERVGKTVFERPRASPPES